MKLDISVSGVEVRPNRTNYMSPSREEALRLIADGVDPEEIVQSVGKRDLLDAIGKEAAMKHFDLVEKE